MTLPKVGLTPLLAHLLGFGSVLNQLTDASGLNQRNFSDTFDEMAWNNKHHLRHFIVVIENTTTHTISATGTLLIERKFTRGTGLVRYPSAPVNL